MSLLHRQRVSVASCPLRDYYKCWVGLKSHFNRNWRPEAGAGEGGGGSSNGDGGGTAAAVGAANGSTQAVSAGNGVTAAR
jgi:hypothetical protein